MSGPRVIGLDLVEPTSGPRVIGLDLSLTATGIAKGDGTTTTVTTRAQDPIGYRLDTIAIEIECVIADTANAYPGWIVAVVEDMPANAQSAGITGRVHGAVLLSLWRLQCQLDLRTVLVPPASLKKYATGKGNATKPDMRMALYQRAGIDERDDNRVDAWWLRAMALDHYGHPVVPMPAANRAALAKIDWPALDAYPVGVER